MCLFNLQAGNEHYGTTVSSHLSFNIGYTKIINDKRKQPQIFSVYALSGKFTIFVFQNYFLFCKTVKKFQENQLKIPLRCFFSGQEMCSFYGWYNIYDLISKLERDFLRVANLNKFKVAGYVRADLF